MNFTDENISVENYNTFTTTTTTHISENLDMVFIVLFGTIFGSVAFICFGIFSCNSCNARNRTCSQTTCMIICSIFIDFIGLLMCNRPIIEHYHNESGTGLCDEYNCSFDILKRCKCKKKEQSIYIEQLYKVVTTQPLDIDAVCIICLEPLGKKKHGELPCNHKFHTKCIKEWMEKSTNKDCPLCRK